MVGFIEGKSARVYGERKRNFFGQHFWARTLADYRKRQALYKRDADLQTAHAACPWFVVGDD